MLHHNVVVGDTIYQKLIYKMADKVYWQELKVNDYQVKNFRSVTKRIFVQRHNACFLRRSSIFGGLPDFELVLPRVMITLTTMEFRKREVIMLKTLKKNKRSFWNLSTIFARRDVFFDVLWLFKFWKIKRYGYRIYRGMPLQTV